MAQLTTRNKMSIAALKQNNNNNYVDVFESPTKKHKDGTAICFFACGDTTGYMSRKAQDQWRSETTHNPLDYEYAEIQTASGAWVPTIYLRGNEAVKLGSM